MVTLCPRETASRTRCGPMNPVPPRIRRSIAPPACGAATMDVRPRPRSNPPPARAPAFTNSRRVVMVPPRSEDVQLADPPEMITVDRQRHGAREEARPAQEGPPHEPPEVQPLPSQDAEARRRAREGQEPLHVGARLHGRSPVLPQERADARVVMT